MATKIQVSRGSLHAKGIENLLRGELFYVPANANLNKDQNFKDNPSYPYDTGTLYIGRPSLNSDGNGIENPIPIAGERAYNGLVYRGNINSNQKDITSPMFNYVRTGDFFIFQEDPTDGQFKNEGYKEGDILVIKHADYNIAPDLNENPNADKSTNISYFKIAGSAGKAKNIFYDDTNTNIGVDNVQDAIEHLSNNKINYVGTIPGDYTFPAIMSEPDNGIGNESILESGSLYLITVDGKPFYNKKRKTALICKKGDLVIWDKDEGWKLIQCGYTDASDIDFDSTDAVAEQRRLGTFIEDKEEHITSTNKLTDVQSALTYLLSHKAMLSSDGKVPLSQLPDTVLGAMQYCGTWDPVNGKPEGVTDPTYQNNWPTGTSYGEDDEEVASTDNNHPGDYYIVKTSFTDIKYYNKKSYYNEEAKTYSEYTILNNGDYIIYTVPRDEKGNYIINDGHWEVIDNSATITSLNFKINGTKDGDKYEYSDTTKEVSIVGNPTFAADGKLVLTQEDNKLTFAGVRLIDQLKDDPNKDSLDKYIPVYSGNTNTLKRGTISNYYSVTSGRDEVHTNADLFIGEKDFGKSANAYVYGDIYVNPHFQGDTDPKNSSIIFRVSNTTSSTNYFEGKLTPNPKMENGAEIILPDKSSNVIGKIQGVTLKKGYLTKSTEDGYIESTSIEEHMSNGKAISVEFHADDLYVNRANTRKIVLGNSSKSLFNDGKFDVDEKTSTLISNSNQSVADVINQLPKTSGTLLNDKDWIGLITGTKGTLPVYGEDSENKKTLIDSKIKQVSGSLYDTLFNNSSNIKSESRTLSDVNIYTPDYTDLKDKDFVDKLYGKEIEIDDGDGNITKKTVGTDDNIILSTDTVVGDVDKDISGNSYIKTPKSLLVSKSLVMGNSDTNSTHMVPGRTLFASSSQYKDPITGKSRKVQDVYVEMPSVSGVLLTDESVIDGGNFLES